MAYSKSQLEDYSFKWSQARLVIAAAALFLGGIPPVVYFNPIPALYGSISTLLRLAWLISGVASVYLLYRWNGQRKLFGRKDRIDTLAFFVSAISGINLGIAGLIGLNIGMAVTSGSFIFTVVGLLYLVSAWRLHKHWKLNDRKLF